MLPLCVAIAILAQAGAAPDLRAGRGPLLVAEEVFTATVLSVEDGDSIAVRTASDRLTVHLAGIDAPELSQPGGQEAKTYLSELTLGKTVTVRLRSVSDRQAKVELNGSDLSEALIRAGMGWHCPRYTDDRDLTKAEADARGAKRGLWIAAQPTPPWLHRGAGSCWQEKFKPRAASEHRPDFSGTWTAISPPDRVGHKLRISQDGGSLTLERGLDPGDAPVSYKLDGTTSRALAGAAGPVDIVAKARWNGAALILEERRWMVRGEEATNIRQVLWVDEDGLLNVELSSPRPIGETDVTTLVLRKDAVRLPERNDAPGAR